MLLSFFNRIVCVFAISFFLYIHGAFLWGQPVSMQWTHVYEDGAEKDFCAEAQADFVEGFSYRLKIKAHPFDFWCRILITVPMFVRMQRCCFCWGVGGVWGLLLFYLPVGGDQAPHVLHALTASCTSLTFKAGFSATLYLTELSIYLFRNGKITALTQSSVLDCFWLWCGLMCV